MKMQDVHRYQSEQLNDLEEEERRKNEELRQKAFEQVQEQEDEIKRLNEVSYVLCTSTGRTDLVVAWIEQVPMFNTQVSMID